MSKKYRSIINIKIFNDNIEIISHLPLYLIIGEVIVNNKTAYFASCCLEGGYEAKKDLCEYFNIERRLRHANENLFKILSHDLKVFESISDTILKFIYDKPTEAEKRKLVSNENCKINGILLIEVSLVTTR